MQKAIGRHSTKPTGHRKYLTSMERTTAETTLNSNHKNSHPDYHKRVCLIAKILQNNFQRALPCEWRMRLFSISSGQEKQQSKK